MNDNVTGVIIGAVLIAIALAFMTGAMTGAAHPKDWVRRDPTPFFAIAFVGGTIMLAIFVGRGFAAGVS